MYGFMPDQAKAMVYLVRAAHFDYSDHFPFMLFDGHRGTCLWLGMGWYKCGVLDSECVGAQGLVGGSSPNEYPFWKRDRAETASSP